MGCLEKGIHKPGREQRGGGSSHHPGRTAGACVCDSIKVKKNEGGNHDRLTGRITKGRVGWISFGQSGRQSNPQGHSR